MRAKTKAIVKGYAKKLRADTTFRRRTGAEIIELAVVVAKRKHPEESFEGAETYAKKESGYWTLERCQQDAKRFPTRTAWAEGNPGAYDAAVRNDWVDLCSSHMALGKRTNGYWTLGRCQEDARQFHMRTAWLNGSPSGYHAARRKGWLELCCAHMTSTQKPVGYWTLERCQEDAKRYQMRTAWGKGCPSGYIAAKRNGWLDLCCTHMALGKQLNGYWTLERCCDDAKHFETRATWKNGSSSAYSAASRSGWLEICCAHMKTEKLERGYWTLDRCQTDASRFATKREWRKESGGGYGAAHKHGWLDICCAHMKPKPPKKKGS
jgi:hypothetical protein